MTPEQMNSACDAVISSYYEMNLSTDMANVTLVTPPKFKRPAGFPRGYLLQKKDDGTSVWHFNAVRLQTWLRKNALVTA